MVHVSRCLTEHIPIRRLYPHVPATKIGSIVAGQTSVKAPEREAFEKSLPEDARIVSIHSLHGPTVSPVGQPLVGHVCFWTLCPLSSFVKIIINHRGSDSAVCLVENLLRSFGSRYVYLSYEEHDLVTANTQAVTHAAFLRWISPFVIPIVIIMQDL